MYTIENLRKYDYFKNVNIDIALDSLTGVLSRKYILDYAKYLIANNIPFYMGMIDIDNFKLINDNNGHDFGDQCLTDVVSNIAEYFKDDGLVGRYGGDEFIFLYFGQNTYENIHKVIANMYNCNMVFRRNFAYNNVEHFVTATTGCSSFPNDATNYQQLFANVDKTLYIGKTKGRNCFIIYVNDKHKNVDVHTKEITSFHMIYSSINKIFKNENSLFENGVIQNALDYLTNNLRYSQALFIKKDGKMLTSKFKIENPSQNTDFDFIKNLFEEDEIYIPKDVSKKRLEDKNFQNLFNKYNFITFMASKIINEDSEIGYLILFESKVERVWQEKDIAILMYLDRQIELLSI